MSTLLEHNDLCLFVVLFFIRKQKNLQSEELIDVFSPGDFCRLLRDNDNSILSPQPFSMIINSIPFSAVIATLSLFYNRTSKVLAELFVVIIVIQSKKQQQDKQEAVKEICY